MNTIDIHIHPEYNLMFRGSEFMADYIIGLMNKADIAVSGILGRVSPFQSINEIRSGNDFTINTVAARPDRLYGMCYIDPSNDPSFVAEELDRVLAHKEIRGIKLEIDVNARDSKLDLVMEKARQYHVPVLHHCWYMSFWNSGPEADYHQRGRSEPHDIADLAKRHPDVSIIMAHLDGCGMRGVLDIQHCPNVYVDTSGGQPFTGILEYAVEKLGPERILFGSDLMGRGLASQLARVYGAQISTADKQKILSDNAIQLFALESLLATI